MVNVTGNQDICYYNFLCAHPLGNLRYGARLGRGPGGAMWSLSPPPSPGGLCLSPCSAFNNILSNLGYVLLGLLFLLIILQREISYNRALLRNDLQALVRSSPGGAPSLAPLPPLDRGQLQVVAGEYPSRGYGEGQGGWSCSQRFQHPLGSWGGGGEGSCDPEGALGSRCQSQPR